MAALTAKIGEVNDKAAQQISTYTNTSVDKSAGLLASNLGDVLGNTATLVGETNELNALNQAKALQEEAVIDFISDSDKAEKDVRERYKKDGKIIPANTSKSQLLRLRQISDQRLLRQNNPSQRANKIITAVYGNTADELAKASERAELTAAANLETQFQAAQQLVTPVMKDGVVDKSATVQLVSTLANAEIPLNNLRASASKIGGSGGVGGRIRSELIPKLLEAKEVVSTVIRGRVFNAMKTFATRTLDDPNQNMLAYQQFFNETQNIQGTIRQSFPMLNQKELNAVTANLDADVAKWKKALGVESLGSQDALKETAENIKKANEIKDSLIQKGIYSDPALLSLLTLGKSLGDSGLAALITTGNQTIENLINSSTKVSENMAGNFQGQTSFGYGASLTKIVEGNHKDPSLKKDNIAALIGKDILKANVNARSNKQYVNNPDRIEHFKRGVELLYGHDATKGNFNNLEMVTNHVTSEGGIKDLEKVRSIDSEAAEAIKDYAVNALTLSISKNMTELSELERENSDMITVINDNGAIKFESKVKPSTEKLSDSDEQYQQALSLIPEGQDNLLNNSRKGRRALQLKEKINNALQNAIRLSIYDKSKKTSSELKNILGFNLYKNVYGTNSSVNVNVSPEDYENDFVVNIGEKAFREAFSLDAYISDIGSAIGKGSQSKNNIEEIRTIPYQGN